MEVCVGDTDELGELIELYVRSEDGDPSTVCETDADPDTVLLGHAVKEELADGEILELEDSVNKSEELPDAELIVVGVPVTV
jgi:hypothetical protein